jgi:hypothetical protein
LFPVCAQSFDAAGGFRASTFGFFLPHPHPPSCAGGAAKLTNFLFMDVSRPLPYLEGLLNRLVIKAIAVSPFIRGVHRNNEACERRILQLWN